MNELMITDGQLKRLQVLYGQYARRSLDVSSKREDRLVWVSGELHRSVTSFKQITRAEAKSLIDALQAGLVIRVPAKRSWDGRDREKLGTEGRHDQIHPESTIASAADFARVHDWLNRLAWNQQQLESWLASPRSPIRSPNPKIRTLGDANRVCWGLKRIYNSNRQKRTA